MNSKFLQGCMVCGSELQHLEQPIQETCMYCGNKQSTYFICPEKHFVCDECHANDALVTIANYCLATKEINPFKMLEELMNHQSVAMHGPEHHALVPAVLVTAYHNLTGRLSEAAIREAINRGSKIPGGYCGIYGACGAGIGTGVAVSVITGSTPLKAQPRALSNLMTSESLQRIASQGGVRCCKSCSKVAIETAVEFFARYLECKFAIGKPQACKHVARNPQCNGSECNYFRERSSNEQYTY